jgi:cell wall-associated NlpC family hydrolase
MVKGLPVPARGPDGKRIDAANKNWQRLAPKSPQPGDVVFLLSHAKHPTEFHHAAVYIGHDLYLSVYGLGGDLNVATLEDMAKAYKAKLMINVTSR